MSLKRVGGQVDSDFCVTDADIGAQVDWAEVFGNDRPVQIEIGPGKGTTLMQLAELFGEHNFLGIEWASKFFRYAGRRMKFWRIGNVKMMRTDAREFVMDRVPDQSIFALHAYFPDPWPKKRHHKRRLFVPQFCQTLTRVLVPGGRVLVATDHQEYFTQIRQNLSAVEGLQESDPKLLAGKSLEAISSNYEAKYVKAGRKIYRVAMEKV